MYFKVKEQNKQYILEAVKSYLKYLEDNCCEYEYTEAIRFLLNKLHRESDWSYVFWPIPDKSKAGKIIVEESTSEEFPRNSEWILCNNGMLSLNALFKSRTLNLYEAVSRISVTSIDYPLKKLRGVQAEITTVNKDTIKIAMPESAFKVMERICTAVNEESFTKRTAPTFAVLDSIQFFLKNKTPDDSVAESLLKVRDQIMIAYNIRPACKEINQKEQKANQEKISITLGEDSLSLIIEALQNYCEIMARFHGSLTQKPTSVEGEKNSKIKRIIHNLKTGLEKQ